MASDFENKDDAVTSCSRRRTRLRRKPPSRKASPRAAEAEPRRPTRPDASRAGQAAGRVQARRGDKAEPTRPKPAAERRTVATAEAPAAEPKEPEASPQPSGRMFDNRRRAQGNLGKNGSALDLVELKDMSIQKLNEIAKDLGVTGLRGTAQAGADLQDPPGAGRKERSDLLRRRARMPARRLRIPARARVQLPARARRRVRLALADPALRSAHRRHRQRPDPPAQGRRAVLRADQGRRDQLRAARGSAQQDLLRQPHASLSSGEVEDGDHQGQLLGTRDGPADAHRQGPARTDRRCARAPAKPCCCSPSPIPSRPIIRKSR